ncbi:MAG: uroporphyrinogen-III synthase [Chloroflexia bacterium]
MSEPTGPAAVTMAQPLQGRRIVVTRAQAQAGDLVAQLRALGAVPLECPAIQVVPPESYAPLDAAIAQTARYDWIVFTSVNGVAAFMARLGHAGQTASRLGSLRLAAIGPATAAALREHGLVPAFVPSAYVAEAIIAQIGDVAGQRMLLPRADIARMALAVGLRAKGALVDEVTAYRTVAGAGWAGDWLRARTIDALTFTSSSTVRYFGQSLAALGVDAADLQRGPQRPAVVCIGPITAQTARELGWPVDAVAEDYTTVGLIAALVHWFGAPGQKEP